MTGFPSHKFCVQASRGDSEASLQSALQAQPPASLNFLGDRVLAPWRGSFPLDGLPAEKSQLLGVSADPTAGHPEGPCL